MPRLLTFEPCESVIIAKNESVSLINILNLFHFQPLPQGIPKDAVVPFRWYLYSNWEFTDEDLKKKWDQRIRLINSVDSSSKMEAIAAFESQPGKHIHRMLGLNNGFPVLAEGKYNFEIAIKEQGQADWRIERLIPFEVKQGKKKTAK